LASIFPKTAHRARQTSIAGQNTGSRVTHEALSRVSCATLVEPAPVESN
jgi:hypothetical protein